MNSHIVTDRDNHITCAFLDGDVGCLQKHDILFQAHHTQRQHTRIVPPLQTIMHILIGAMVIHDHNLMHFGTLLVDIEQELVRQMPATVNWNCEGNFHWVTSLISCRPSRYPYWGISSLRLRSTFSPAW